MRQVPQAQHISLTNFLDSGLYTSLTERLVAAQRHTANEEKVKDSLKDSFDDSSANLFKLGAETEAAIMATTLTPSHPEFVFVFAAVRRADRHPRICMLRTVAGDERSARRSLVREAMKIIKRPLPMILS